MSRRGGWPTKCMVPTAISGVSWKNTASRMSWRWRAAAVVGGTPAMAGGRVGAGVCLAPAAATARDWAEAAGRRWSIEGCFEAAKQETGLDEYEVRSWHGGYRHITLSRLALAFLSVIRGQANGVRPGKKRAPRLSR